MNDAIYFLSQQIVLMAAKLETALEKNNDTQKKIHKELLISNLPQDLRNDQRYYFELEEALELNASIRDSFEEKLNAAEEKDQIEKYEKKYKAYNDRVDQIWEDLKKLEEKGCIGL